MQRLHETAVQLEECKRFILSGDTSHLRLALILLDNAIEVMMHRVVEDELRRANMYGRMLKTFPTMPLDDKGKQLRQEIEFHVVSEARQKKIRRYFGEKITFLSEDRDRVPMPIARALRHLHDYRNKAQHHDQVRVESLRPAVLILLDIATDFMVRLEPGSTVWSSHDDLGWLERYGIASRLSSTENIRQRIAMTIRADLPLEMDGIRQALVSHLTDRLDAMSHELTFVVENSSLGSQADHVLKAIQFCEVHSAGDPRQGNPVFDAFVPQYTTDSFLLWDKEVHDLQSTEDRFEMFDLFASIEDDFEPLERMIDDTVSAIDQAIQLEIDRLRGK